MKRVLCLLVCAVMLLTMIPMATMTVGAVDVEGDWTTYRSAADYDDPDYVPGEGEEPNVYLPEAGYMYTDEGFMVVPADYTDTAPFLTVQTKLKQSVKDGIYLQFRVDEYSYGGGVGADQWICLTLNTEQKVTPGATQYGGGWLTLIRGDGDGFCNTLAHLTEPATEESGGAFYHNNLGSSTEVPMDDDGREIYTLEIEWINDSEYVFTINGVVQPEDPSITALLEKLDANGEFYLGVTLMSTVKSGKAALTILKYGTSEADATVPVGTDSKEPEENEMVIAPIEDPDTIEANKPAILWNPNTYNIKPGNNCTFTVLGDDTWRLNASSSPLFFNFAPKRSWSYDAVDFPVFGIMFRDIWITDGMLWYSAGDVMGANHDYTMGFSVYNGRFYGQYEEYVFVPLDMTGLWEGRINNLRIDMATNDPEARVFDICFAGMFRSEEEAYAYAAAWADERGLTSGSDTEAPDTEAPDTEAPETEAPDTEAPSAGTEAPVAGTEAPNAETDASVNSGCGSVIGFSAVGLITLAGAFFIKKKN